MLSCAWQYHACLSCPLLCRHQKAKVKIWCGARGMCSPAINIPAVQIEFLLSCCRVRPSQVSLTLGQHVGTQRDVGAASTAVLQPQILCTCLFLQQSPSSSLGPCQHQQVHSDYHYTIPQQDMVQNQNSASVCCRVPNLQLWVPDGRLKPCLRFWQNPCSHGSSLKQPKLRRLAGSGNTSAAPSRYNFNTDEC